MIAKIVMGMLVGGATGACPLTSNPYVSTLSGAGRGILLATQLH